MLLVSECVARAALERQESRGGHTRDDYPEADPQWRQVNVVCELAGALDAAGIGSVLVRRQPLPEMPAELLGLFERDELSKYMTDAELERLPRPRRPRSGSGAMTRIQVWRGDETGGKLRLYDVEVNEGEVVLDIVHRLQATQAPRPRRPVELQGRQVRVVQRRGQRPSAAAVHDPDEHLRPGRGPHHHAAARLPRDQGPRHRRVVQLREGAGGPVVRAAAGPGARGVPDAAGRRRAQPGVPQVHRVLPLPEHLPRRP